MFFVLCKINEVGNEHLFYYNIKYLIFTFFQPKHTEMLKQKTLHYILQPFLSDIFWNILKLRRL